MGKIRIVECRMCGEKFETTACNAKWCPDCRQEDRKEKDAIYAQERAMRAARNRELEARRRSREKRLKARDEEYAALGVPVTTRVAANGMVVETRGQVRIASSCGILGGISSKAF